jgi:hypothetical protein
MKKYNLISEHLTEGQKITLVFQGEFGGVSAIQTTYIGCHPTPHYQNCPENMIGVTIAHRPRGNRKRYYKTISYNTPIVVYDGWVSIDTDNLVYKTTGDHLSESRYAMHDSQYFFDLLKIKPNAILTDIPGR